MHPLFALALAALLAAPWHQDIEPADVGVASIQQALAQEGIFRDPAALERLKPLFDHAVGAQRQLEARGRRSGSQVGQDAVELAAGLDLDPRSSAPALVRAIKSLAAGQRRETRRVPEWREYFEKTASLESAAGAASLFARYGFHPVKISWEDIGRDEGSVWGSRISDVGIWGREEQGKLSSARLMLTVRRDDNFRDKVLMVPAENIKLHRRAGGTLEELTLPQRLRELGLLSPSGRFDKNVIVSNQFSIVPVPRKEHAGVDTLAFNFSIFPYGSTNFVIADTIEGASDVVVGPGDHQLIYFNANGKKAPFTAARASDRPDVVAAAQEMRAAGLDVDVQRFYLIQVPLKHGAGGIESGRMGTPPMGRMHGSMPMMAAEQAADLAAPSSAKKQARGLEDVVVGHGDEEGAYQAGSGFSGKRADERVRVTICYFVTPRGELTEADMEQFARRFSEWDQKAIWGGSFVVPQADSVAAQ